MRIIEGRNHAKPRRLKGEAGYSMAVMLMLLVVLSLVGAAAFQRVRGDVRYTGRDLKHLKAQAVAESAISWAQETLTNPTRTTVFPYTLSTHKANGTSTQPTKISGVNNPDKLPASDVPAVYEGGSPAYSSGWIKQSTTNPVLSLTGSSNESMAFKVWYPDNNTVRISGKGTVEGVVAQVEMFGQVD